MTSIYHSTQQQHVTSCKNRVARYDSVIIQRDDDVWGEQSNGDTILFSKIRKTRWMGKARAGQIAKHSADAHDLFKVKSTNVSAKAAFLLADIILE